jgi:murein DD-endopeptidase MepM/ murein hydrolase activator NlpD
MKIRWGQKQFTLMMIPDANRRIVQWKLPVFFIYIIPSCTMLIVVIIAVTVYLMFDRSRVEKASMMNYLNGQIENLRQSIDHKDERITELQSQIIDLSQQADQFKLKLDQVKELENELGDMTGENIAKLEPTVLFGPSSVNGDSQIGGESRKVTEQNMRELVAATQTNYNQLVSELDTSLSNISSLEQTLQYQEHLRRVTPSIWPTTSRLITSGYGVRMDPFTGQPAFHSGLDIAGKQGDPVFATADGTVTFAGYDATHGNHLLIDHSNGIVTHYMHLSKILVKNREEVSKGEKIGLMGTTGRSTGPHVHYEVLKNNRTVDPTPYLRGRG